MPISATEHPGPRQWSLLSVPAQAAKLIKKFQQQLVETAVLSCFRAI